MPEEKKRDQSKSKSRSGKPRVSKRVTKAESQKHQFRWLATGTTVVIDLSVVLAGFWRPELALALTPFAVRLTAVWYAELVNGQRQ